MNHSLAAIILCAVLLPSSVCAGYFKTGQNIKGEAISYLRQDDKARLTDSEQFEAARFSAYSAGLYDGLQLDGVSYCVPTDLTIGQLGTIFARYINNHPETWNLAASGILRMALRDSFPCKKK